jgi:hypothetical protein
MYDAFHWMPLLNKDYRLSLVLYGCNGLFNEGMRVKAQQFPSNMKLLSATTLQQSQTAHLCPQNGIKSELVWCKLLNLRGVVDLPGLLWTVGWCARQELNLRPFA